MRKDTQNVEVVTVTARSVLIYRRALFLRKHLKGHPFRSLLHLVVRGLCLTQSCGQSRWGWGF